MSSTFLTRLRVGEILVDAKGVSRLVSRRVGLWPLAMLGLAGLGAIVVAVVLSPGVHHLIELIALRDPRPGSASGESEVEVQRPRASCSRSARPTPGHSSPSPTTSRTGIPASPE